MCVGFLVQAQNPDLFVPPQHDYGPLRMRDYKDGKFSKESNAYYAHRVFGNARATGIACCMSRWKALFRCVLFGLILPSQPTVLQAIAQSASGQGVPKRTVPAKPMQFDVVSIRRNKSGGPSALQILPDGYRAINVSLGLSIKMAYLPKALWLAEPVQGEPAWIGQEKYDILAKIAPSDQLEWQRQNDNHKKMLEAMLQAVLVDRCKLVVHHVPRQASAWGLVVDKSGPKFKEMKPGEMIDGKPVPSEGIILGFRRGENPKVTFMGYSMDQFADWLSQSSPMSPVADKTGLTGRYDLVVSQIDMSSSPSPTGVTVSLSNLDPSNIWNLEALGLKLIPVKIPVETLVIDHIQRPSEN